MFPDDLFDMDLNMLPGDLLERWFLIFCHKFFFSILDCSSGTIFPTEENMFCKSCIFKKGWLPAIFCRGETLPSNGTNGGQFGSGSPGGQTDSSSLDGSLTWFFSPEIKFIILLKLNDNLRDKF